MIRVAANPGPGTLRREAELATGLPPAVGYPQLIGSGVIDRLEWMAPARLPGDNLASAWQSLDSEQRALASPISAPGSRLCREPTSPD